MPLSEFSKFNSFLAYLLGLSITMSYLPLEIGLGIIRTSVPLIFLIAVLFILNRREYKWDSLDWILLLLVLWASCALIVVPTSQGEIVNANKIITQIGALISAGYIRKIVKSGNSSAISLGLLHGFYFQVLLANYQIFVGSGYLNSIGYTYPRFIFEPSRGLVRAFGSFFSPVIFGSFIAILTIGLLIIFKSDNKRKLLITILGINGVLVSQTRGAIVALLVCLIIFYIKELSQKHIPVFTFLVITCSLILITMFWFLRGNDSRTGTSIVSRISSIPDISRDAAFRVRIGIWDETINLITQSPIFGNGELFSYSSQFTGSVSILSNLDFSSPLLQVYGHPHNTFLFLALIYGVFPGLFLFIFALYKLARKDQGYLVVTAFLISGLTETLWSSLNLVVLLFALPGLRNKRENFPHIAYK